MYTSADTYDPVHEAARARGDADIAAVGALLADPGRCRILLALDDGRALPASRLAADLLGVERHGRHR